MEILKTGLKLVGSAALGTAGIASAILRTAASAAGSDELADVIGTIQDASFNKIQDIWTPDEEKDEKYYERQGERSMERAEYATRSGEAKRNEYERMKAKVERERNNH